MAFFFTVLRRTIWICHVTIFTTNAKCSKQAITWYADKKSVIDTDKCNRCLECIDACFISAITMTEE
ncbi:4Fe-4S binding protein [Photobacterium aquimaris]|uniref:4Fe-4S binding protein n=1 Tax=Photobacterium aquimaris TaxID=512643 RepID=UPI000B41CE33